jgi:sugar phosphate isomerase/epimerase
VSWNVTLSVFADEIAREFGEQLDAMAKEGLDRLDLRAAWGTNVLDLSDDQLGEVQRLLGQRGMRVACIGSPIGKTPIVEPFEDQVPRFRRALEVAKRVGATNIRIFSFYLPKGEPPAYYRDEVLRRIAAMAAIAAKEAPELLLLHENERNIYGEQPAECADILNSVAARNLKAIFDPANFVQAKVRPFQDAFPLLAPQIAYMHIKDATWAEGRVTPAGQGDGQLREILSALRARGWEGVLALEPHLAHAGRSSGWTGPEQLHVAVDALNGLLRELN